MATEKEVELERGTSQRGFRHGLHEFLAEVDLDSLKYSNIAHPANRPGISMKPPSSPPSDTRLGIVDTIHLLPFHSFYTLAGIFPRKASGAILRALRLFTYGSRLKIDQAQL